MEFNQIERIKQAIQMPKSIVRKDYHVTISFDLIDWKDWKINRLLGISLWFWKKKWIPREERNRY
jgi:hypothetical protein